MHAGICKDLIWIPIYEVMDVRRLGEINIFYLIPLSPRQIEKIDIQTFSLSQRRGDQIEILICSWSRRQGDQIEIKIFSWSRRQGDRKEISLQCPLARYSWLSSLLSIETADWLIQHVRIRLTHCGSYYNYSSGNVFSWTSLKTFQ